MFAFFAKKGEELKPAEPREVREVLRSLQGHYEEFELKLIKENSMITREIATAKGNYQKIGAVAVNDDLIPGKEMTDIEAVCNRISQLDRIIKENINDLMKLEGIEVKKCDEVVSEVFEEKESTSNFEVRKSLAKIFCCCWRSREKVAPDGVEMEEFSPEQRNRMRKVQLGAADLKLKATELNEIMKKQGK